MLNHLHLYGHVAAVKIWAHFD